MSVKISKETTIGQLIASFPQVAPILFQVGMHCLGCPSATSETIEEACFVHEADCDALVKKLNDFLAEKEA
jgi:hybrid cluster-associated redox disulfide protein